MNKQWFSIISLAFIALCIWWLASRNGRDTALPASHLAQETQNLEVRASGLESQASSQTDKTLRPNQINEETARPADQNPPSEKGLNEKTQAQESKDVKPGQFRGWVQNSQGETIHQFEAWINQTREPHPIIMEGDGRFTVENLDPEKVYQIEIKAPAYETKGLSFYAASDPQEEVVIRLKPGYRLGVRLVDRKGAPVMASMTAMTGDTYTDAYVDNKSQFLFEGLPPIVSFHARAPGYSEVFIESIPLDKLDMEVVMPPDSMVRGQLLNADTGEPVNHFEYRYRPAIYFVNSFNPRIQNANTWIEAASNRGLFQIDQMSVGAKLRIEFKAEGFQTLRESPVVVVDRDQGEQQLKIFKIKPIEKRIEGRVVFKDGFPAPGVEVTLLAHPSQDRYLPSTYKWSYLDRWKKEGAPYTITDGNGQFSLPHPGENHLLHLFFQGKDIAKTHLPDMQHRAFGKEDPLLVTIPREAQILGVCNIEKYPYGMFINLEQTQKMETDLQKLDEDGRFHFSQLAPGDYKLQWLEQKSAINPVIETRHIHLDEGDIVEITPGFDETYTLSGQALIQSEPMHASTLTLLSKDSSNQQLAIRDTQEPGPNGSFLFQNLSPGEYVIVAFEKMPPDPNKAITHTNRINFTMPESDLERPFVFNDYSKITGQFNQITEGSVLLTKLGRYTGDAHQSTLIEAGMFSFSDVAPGPYKMTMRDQNLNNYTLFSELTVNPGQDLDLGNLAPKETGYLLISISGDHDLRYANVTLRSETAGYPITQQLWNAQLSLIKELPAGFITVDVSKPLSPAWVSETISVEILPNQTVEVELNPHPYSGVYFHLNDKKAKIAASRLLGEETLNLPALKQMPSFQDGGFSMGFSGRWGHVSGIKPGAYTLEIITEAGLEKRISFNLEEGEIENLAIDL